MDADTADRQQVANRLGVEQSQLAAWEGLGVLHEDAGGGFDAEQIERARLLRFLGERGFPPTAVVEVSRDEGDLLERFVDHIGRTRSLGTPVDEAAAATGIDDRLVARLRAAAGVEDERELFDDDIDMLRVLGEALELGLPEDALVQIVRVFADALARVAEAECRLFHFYVHEALRSSGQSGRELVEATQAISGPLRDVIEPTILYFHRKAWERALREDLTLHLARGDQTSRSPVATMNVAVLFVDVSGFTPLTDVRGDSVAADVLDRFSTVVRTAAAHSDGRIVKQIGDEFMLAFPTASAAVAFGIDVRQRAQAAELPYLRMGAHVGTALYRDGDYVGATVNLAARATSEAGPGDFLVTREIREASVDVLGRVAFESLGERHVRGVGDDLELYLVTQNAVV